MDIFKNPDEVIKEVEDDEARREQGTDIEDELDESPEDEGESPESADD
jgi:hypothetical protein